MPPRHRLLAQSVWPCLLGLSLLLAVGCERSGKDPGGYQVVAMVNGVPVTVETFAGELAFVQRTSAGVLPQGAEEMQSFRQAVLEDLIDRLVVLGAARKAAISVPADAVDRELLKLKAEYHGTGFDEALAEGQLSQQELRERTRVRLTVERYFVQEVYARVAVTDPEIEAYYQEKAEEFAQPEQVRAAQIVVKTAEEARRVLGELRKGMAFDEAARRFSLSPDAKAGGDLGFFSRGVMPPAFDQICFSLPVGRVSDVVATEYGFHVFKVLERRPAIEPSLERVQAEVERALLRQKHAAAQQRTLSRLRAEAQITIDQTVLAAVSP